MKKPRVLNFDCGEGGYISKLQNLGFAYKYDIKYKGDTVPEELCKYILDPTIEYHKNNQKSDESKRLLTEF